MWGFGETWKGIEYIINKPIRGGYSLMKNETFNVKLKEGHMRRGGGGMSGRQGRWW
jgi:hypothetical protein